MELLKSRWGLGGSRSLPEKNSNAPGKHGRSRKVMQGQRGDYEDSKSVRDTQGGSRKLVLWGLLDCLACGWTVWQWKNRGFIQWLYCWCGACVNLCVMRQEWLTVKDSCWPANKNNKYTLHFLTYQVTQVLHRCQESIFLFDSIRPLIQIDSRNTNLSLRLNILNFSKDTVKVNVELVRRQFP